MNTINSEGTVECYTAAGRRAASWLADQQDADGAFTDAAFQEDIYHKNAYALGIAGLVAAANRLLRWVVEHDLRPDGELRHFYSPGRQQVYKDSWVCLGAHRLGRFDLSYPIAAFLLRFQAPCGGFLYHGLDDTFAQALTTAWAGTALLMAGHSEPARRAGDALLAMVAQQPDSQRFYFRMSLDGALLTDVPAGGPRAAYVDASQPAQLYYETGIIMVFLCRLFQATGEPRYLEGARSVFAFTLRCADDAYAHTTSGKGGVGAALLYALTGDAQARAAACRFADFLLQHQTPEGIWRIPNAPDTRINRLDMAGEYTVWLFEIAGALAAGASNVC